jgi:hypothetical protein
MVQDIVRICQVVLVIKSDKMILFIIFSLHLYIELIIASLLSLGLEK